MTDTDAMSMDVSTTPISMNTLVTLSKTPTVPERYYGKPMDMYAAVLVGRELGVGPMESITELFLVKGRVSMSAKLMGSLVQRQGHQLRTRLGPEQAEVEAWRKMDNGELVNMGSVIFTKQDAQTAGLWGTGAWKAWPQVMLGWRALSIAARFYFPECLTSVKYEASEMDVEGAEMPALPDAVVVADEDDDGEDALDAEAVAEVLDAEVVSEEQDKGATE